MHLEVIAVWISNGDDGFAAETIIVDVVLTGSTTDTIVFVAESISIRTKQIIFDAKQPVDATGLAAFVAEDHLLYHDDDLLNREDHLLCHEDDLLYDEADQLQDEDDQLRNRHAHLSNANHRLRCGNDQLDYRHGQHRAGDVLPLTVSNQIRRSINVCPVFEFQQVSVSRTNLNWSR